MKQQTRKFESQKKILLLLEQTTFQDYDRLIINETKQILSPKIQEITNVLDDAINRKRKR